MKTLVLLASLATAQPSGQNIVPDLGYVAIADSINRITLCVAAKVVASKEYGKRPLVELVSGDWDECTAPAHAAAALIDERYGKGVGKQYLFTIYRTTLAERVGDLLRATGK